MKLIVGLGNPGAQYNKTRHNAGFMVVDALASKFAIGQIAKSRFNAVVLDANIGCDKVLLIKPTGFMNRSGQAVGEAIRFFKLDPAEDLLVIVDDIALPVGSIRVRKSGGAGGHNGLADIDRTLGFGGAGGGSGGGASYPRVRVGIGEVPRLMNQADWVLSRFMSEEMDKVKEGIDKASKAAEHILDQGIVSAMNIFNEKLIKPKRKDHPNDQSDSDSKLSSVSKNNQETKPTNNTSAN